MSVLPVNLISGVEALGIMAGANAQQAGIIETFSKVRQREGSAEQSRASAESIEQDTDIKAAEHKEATGSLVDLEHMVLNFTEQRVLLVTELLLVEFFLERKCQVTWVQKPQRYKILKYKGWIWKKDIFL